MTVKIPPHVQEFIKGKPGWVATASRDGTPNVAIKGSLRVLDDEHLVFADLYSLKTRKNLEENPKVAVMVMDTETRVGYSLKGTVELIAQGPLYDQTVEALKKAPVPLPPPKYVVKIAVETIYDQSLGPEAGKKIA
jgi:predicted pyridoxine 5'-phosphate oxidase superfamily flavin-nucleotide-binding protein